MSVVILATRDSDSEQFESFIEHLDNILTSQEIESEEFIDKANQLLEDEQLLELLDHILSLDDALVQETKSSVSAFYILNYLCSRLDAKSKTQGIENLLKYINGRSEEFSNLKFRLLATIFNTVQEPQLKYQVLSNILKLALQLSRPHILLVHLTSISNYTSQWKLNKEQEIDILKLSLQLINLTDDKYYKEKLQVYTQFLTCLDAQFDTKVFESNKSEIEGILLTVLKTFPDNSDFNNLLLLKPVQQVQKSNQPLYSLFELSLNGDYTSYESWKAKNGSVLSQLQIKEEKVIDRVRLRSFFALAQKQQQLKLSEVQKALNLSEIETEFWVIKALQSGHIDGKIDQLQGTVYINTIHDSSFRNQEWQEMEASLDNICKKFSGIINEVTRDQQQN